MLTPRLVDVYPGGTLFDLGGLKRMARRYQVIHGVMRDIHYLGWGKEMAVYRNRLNDGQQKPVNDALHAKCCAKGGDKDIDIEGLTEKSKWLCPVVFIESAHIDDLRLRLEGPNTSSKFIPILFGHTNIS